MARQCPCHTVGQLKPEIIFLFGHFHFRTIENGTAGHNSTDTKNSSEKCRKVRTKCFDARPESQVSTDENAAL